MARFASEPEMCLTDQIGAAKQTGETRKLGFDSHNAVWTIVERMSEQVPFYLKPIATGAATSKAVRGRVIR